jgi:hypothetical protein
MIFTAPFILVALLALPALWWLLRATPPAPRAQAFPAIRLLAGLTPPEHTPARTPWWLLALRLTAAGLIIIGVAGPILTGSGLALIGAGPVLLIMDNSWEAGPDWAARVTAADSVLDRAARENRDVALLATADTQAGARPHATPPMPVSSLRPILAALRPASWPSDRAAAAEAVTAVPKGPAFYIPDGVAADGDAALAAALASHGPVTSLLSKDPARLLEAETTQAGLTAHIHRSASAAPDRAVILAETGDGRAVGRFALDIPAGATEASVPLTMPPELRNQLTTLRLADTQGAGAVALLDEGAKRRPVGLLGTSGGAETPLLGTMFYLDRALAPTTELRRGDLNALLSRKISMLVVADRGLEGADATRIEAWVKQGGLLVRFAGPNMAEGGAGPNPLLPVQLLQGDRQLGGAMSWSAPAHLAPFPAGPFAGLAIPADVTVSRQMLAEPSTDPALETWAKLQDGTPLVSAARLGAGELVFFGVTANADWSNLPLSGLFVDMMNRLVARAAGVAVADDARRLAPAQSLDGFGILGPVPQAATALAANALADTVISPLHPPGFYGPEADRHALNLAGHIPLKPERPVRGQTLSLDTAPHDVPLGPAAIALALALLCADMLLTLKLRGLLRPVAASLMCMFMASAHAADSPALGTHLAYIVTGDSSVDTTSRQGLAGLSAYMNDRTAAVLAAPAPVVPGHDDLSFYPLLYWPITDSTALKPDAVAALNDYMRHGGVIVIDTRGGTGSGAGFAPGADAALRRAASGLDIPALTPLTAHHVLAHAFYLLNDFPGRYDGGTVWVQQAEDRSNDSVSPVIIGANDWAAAWAEDEDGKPLYATIPGGPRQRVLAFRFGVNLVMYALTGNYKGDQVHVPAILERLGQ